MRSARLLPWRPFHLPPIWNLCCIHPLSCWSSLLSALPNHLNLFSQSFFAIRHSPFATPSTPTLPLISVWFLTRREPLQSFIFSQMVTCHQIKCKCVHLIDPVESNGTLCFPISDFNWPRLTIPFPLQLFHVYSLASDGSFQRIKDG